MDISGAIVISEDTFPFSKGICAEKTCEKQAGWYLQQLLKLYAPLFIEGCSETCLLVDADTVFHKRVRFSFQGKIYMDKTFETHAPYFAHMARLHPSFLVWKRQTSGIVNCMVVQKGVLRELFAVVEEYHGGKPFWQVFLDAVVEKESSGASEYEIYYHYVMRKYRDRFIERPLQFFNFGKRKDLVRGVKENWHYVTYHWHVQK